MSTASKEVHADLSAIASGILARTSFLASIGELQTDESSVRSRLGQSGPHGHQLVKELDTFKTVGGELERISPGNWTKSGYPLKELFGRRGELGFNSLDKIAYRRNLTDSLSDVLMHTGPVGPRTGCAFTLAHEIGHFDGIDGQSFFATGADPKVIRKQSLEKETSAIISSLRWQQELGHPIQDSSSLRNALKNKQLGNAIKQTWSYPELKSMSQAESNTVTNEYLKRAFNESIDSKGHIRNYSLEHLRQINSGARPNEIDKISKATFSESGASFSRLPTRIGQTVGTLGLLYIVADISTGFRKSPQEGVRQIAKVGANWIGWESGVTTMLKIAGRRTPLACITAGIIGSVGAERLFDSL